MTHQATSTTHPVRHLDLSTLVATLVALVATLALAPAAFAATLYWDGNGSPSGTGATPSGTWGVDQFWSTNAGGSGIPGVTITTAIDDLIFSAGTDAIGSFTVTVDGTQYARNITFQEGTPTLTGGTLDFGPGNTLTVEPGAGNPTISSNLTIGGNHTFTVGTGRTLALDTGTFTRNIGATLAITGTGTMTSTMTNLASNNPTGIVGTWATVDTGAATRYATFSGSTITSLTGTAAADDTALIDTTGLVNYDLASAAGNPPDELSANTIRYAGGSGTTAPGATSFSVNGLLNAGTSTWTIGGANPLTIGAERELIVNAANNAITISSVIQDNGGGASALVKTGGNILTLSNANTYTGKTYLNAGTTSIASDASLGPAPGAPVADQITFNGGTLRWDSSFGTPISSNRGMLLAGNGTLNTQSFNNSYAGVISGSGVLTKSGSGTLTLTGDNTFTGSVTVSGGTLSVATVNSVVGGSPSSNLGAPTTATNGRILITSTGTLQYTGPGETTDRIIAPSGGGSGYAVGASGSGPLVFTADGHYGGMTGGGQHTIVLTGTNTGLNTFQNLYNQQGLNNVSIPGVLKLGSGTWLMAGTQSQYAGTTTVSEGTLIVGGDAINKVNRQTPVTYDSTAETITLVGNPFVEGDKVVFLPAPGGLSTTNSTASNVVTTNIYYVRNVVGDSFQVSSTPAGSIIDLTGATAGTRIAQIGVLGSTNSAVVLGDATTTSNNASPSLLTGGAFTIGRDIVIADQPTAGTYTIGGATDNSSTFSNLVTLNQNLTVAQVATSGGNALSLTGGLVSGNATAKTITFAGPGDIVVGTGAIADGAGGTLAVTKTGGGLLTVLGTHDYTGATLVEAGTLMVDGNIASSALVSISTGASLAGNGTVGLVAGAGSVNPGSSPGLLTGSQVDPTGGLDFNFEFTLANAVPTWAAVENDVFRLTNPTTPFTAALDGDNEISLFLTSAIAAGLIKNDVLFGGFYTDAGDHLAALSGALLKVFVEDAGGSLLYNGVNYSPFVGATYFVVGTVANPEFSEAGFLTTFTYAIPEPTSLALLAATAVLGLIRRRR